MSGSHKLNAKKKKARHSKTSKTVKIHQSIRIRITVTFRIKGIGNGHKVEGNS